MALPSPLKLDTYDIIICGGGTAGCVLAARLSEDPNLTVLLLEAGENANDDPRISTPMLFPAVLDNPERDWCFMSEPSPGLNGRRIAMPRGKMLGGSSAINVMCLIYPSKAGIDGWAEMGNPGWDWEGLTPYFRKFKTYYPPSAEIKEKLAMDWITDPEVQGKDGPIAASYPTSLDPVHEAWIKTWKGLGKAVTGDPLTGHHTGGYISAVSVNPEKGTRSHAGVEYYVPAANRPNLHVVTGALIDKVELDNRDPTAVKATGVTFIYSNLTYTAWAKREVIISGGAIGSPAILERSGIGSTSVCASAGIKNIIDNPGVGENLQDHLMCGLSYEVKDGVITGDVMRDPNVVQQVMELYQTSKSGPLAMGGSYTFAYTPLLDFLDNPGKPTRQELVDLLDRYNPEMNDALTDPNFKSEKAHAAFKRRMILSPEEASATLCLHPVQCQTGKESPKEIFGFLVDGNFVTLLPQLTHPFSRGNVHIVSKDPQTYPKIDPNYFSNPIDAEIMARHMMQCEILVKAPPFCDMFKPGGRRLPEGKDALTLEHALDVVRSGATSNYHQCGTCAMMPLALGGVVDERLKVHGTTNLRVCDASIFPLQVRGNIQSTVYAVAEKGSDIIKEDLLSGR